MKVSKTRHNLTETSRSSVKMRSARRKRRTRCEDLNRVTRERRVTSAILEHWYARLLLDVEAFFACEACSTRNGVQLPKSRKRGRSA